MPVRPVDRSQRPWNKGLLIGQKKPLEPKHVWTIRVRSEITQSWPGLVIFRSGGVKSGIARGICRHRLDQLRNLTVELHSSGGVLLQLIRTARKPTGRGHFSDGSNDITKMVRGLNRVSQQCRHVARALRNVKPYVVRFVEHVRFRQGEPRWNSNTSTWWRCRIRTRTS